MDHDFDDSVLDEDPPLDGDGEMRLLVFPDIPTHIPGSDEAERLVFPAIPTHIPGADEARRTRTVTRTRRKTPIAIAI